MDENLSKPEVKASCFAIKQKPCVTMDCDAVPKQVGGLNISEWTDRDRKPLLYSDSNNSSSLKRHKYNHNAEKPYKCDICN